MFGNLQCAFAPNSNYWFKPNEELKTFRYLHPYRNVVGSKAGLKQTTFTDEEKKSLGALLATAIKPIKVNIEGTACVYRTRLDNSVLMKRSAVQYLIDDFGSFPVENSNLTKVLEDANIGVSVKILDELIDDLCDLSDSDEGSNDRELMGAKKVPSSHTWWAR
ncbi:hypothetical protein evm_005340 [Chilo suppressalis]|nr:hypothetical protein evm_005340 [Chilo suppressalis]